MTTKLRLICRLLCALLFLKFTPGLWAVEADLAALDWAILQRLLAAPPDGPTLPDQIARLQRVAAKARAFQSLYPAHSRATEALKLELITGLQAVSLGALDTENCAARAAAYRANGAIAASHRFQVALAMENLAEPANTSAPGLAGRRSAKEELADKFLAEFGGTPEVCGLYRDLLLNADADGSARIAGKLQSANVPAAFKATAQRLAERNSVSGKSIELTLATMDGGKVVFERINKLTVVYFWDTQTSADLALLNRYKTVVGPEIGWLYVGLGSAYPDTSGRLPFPGAECLDVSLLGGSAAGMLGAEDTPWVALIGANGKLVGSGPVDRLPELLAAAKH